ncbi:hypothetical protein RHMOL_Rhmol05G0022700 [Rhododendron molle]|uniref:Uncharacterized protein n=1 Tax=Rhododendron molle TaxID=49168 RepID=A0ACC0NKX1_RHOML|nr:hypothetical protein RHMOL_Rhmol05G0022700 [Rhododendron molle]
MVVVSVAVDCDVRAEVERLQRRLLLGVCFLNHLLLSLNYQNSPEASSPVPCASELSFIYATRLHVLVFAIGAEETDEFCQKLVYSNTVPILIPSLCLCFAVCRGKTNPYRAQKQRGRTTLGNRPRGRKLPVCISFIRCFCAHIEFDSLASLHYCCISVVRICVPKKSFSTPQNGVTFMKNGLKVAYLVSATSPDLVVQWLACALGDTLPCVPISYLVKEYTSMGSGVNLELRPLSISFASLFDKT